VFGARVSRSWLLAQCDFFNEGAVDGFFARSHRLLRLLDGVFVGCVDEFDAWSGKEFTWIRGGYTRGEAAMFVCCSTGAERLILVILVSLDYL
jgi:hypothetical protein